MIKSFINQVLNKTINWSTICAPFLIWLLPSNFFDTGKSICLFTNLSGYDCYGCGLTRAVTHLLHFEFTRAWEYNKLAFIVVPAFSVLWIKAIYEVQGKKMPGVLGKLTSASR